MKYLITLLLIANITFVYSQKIKKTEKEKLVLIKTNMGNMTVKLYNETPRHRDEFLKLVRNGHFNGTLFYRVINKFVIQGGSADSRNAAPGISIGYGSFSKIIDSEFVKERHHKKGALAAPRQPDKINHYKESDVSQFYIVQGKVYPKLELELLEKKTNIPIRNKIVKKYYNKEVKAKLKKLKAEKKAKEFNKLLRKVKSDIEFYYRMAEGKVEFTQQQKKDYTTIGGVHHLDGEYTVFGEVIKGLEVIDKIAKLKTDKGDRPFKDVKMKVIELK